MNKKFFAALASATMAFTASGSIAVFADGFVEESNIVDNGDVKPVETEVVWNKDNFGALVTLDESDFGGYTGKAGTLVKNKSVKTADLANVKTINLEGLKGEIKGLEYFTGLTSFYDVNATAVTNTTLDFSANTDLTSITVNKASGLTKIAFPNPTKTEDELDKYILGTLDLRNTKLTALDLSAQKALTNVVVINNENLAEVALVKGTSLDYVELTNLDLQNNALETVNLDYYDFGATGKLNLSNNHIGALDLSKAKADGSNVSLAGQNFYVSETLKNVNLAETFENFDKEAVVEKTGYDKKTGVIALSATGATYEYKTGLGKLGVTLETANPMNRLYNPNSGEHFYTADLEEKVALVKLGWNDEGYGWVAPVAPETVTETSDQPVYRLYNPNAGDHHYTMSKGERNTLVAYGWKDEGTGWYSAEDAKHKTNGTVTVLRQYNPFANGAGSHNYTTDKAENDYLVSLGWTPEGKAWKALK